MRRVTAQAYKGGEKAGAIAVVEVRPKIWLPETLAAPTAALFAAAKAANLPLKLNSGFRFHATQERIYRERMDLPGDTSEVRQRKAEIRRIKGVAARPGFSLHQDGKAIDVSTIDKAKRSAGYRWLRGNAARFGFAQTLRSEPWHLVYRGNEMEQAPRAMAVGVLVWLGSVILNNKQAEKESTPKYRSTLMRSLVE